MTSHPHLMQKLNHPKLFLTITTLAGITATILLSSFSPDSKISLIPVGVKGAVNNPTKTVAEDSNLLAVDYAPISHRNLGPTSDDLF